MKRLLTLFSVAFISVSGIAQIPNAGFEAWTSPGSYVTPTGWDNPNSYTTALGFYTCDSAMDSPPEGSAYLKLTTKKIPIVGTLIPGVAVSGVINISGTTYSVSGGFPSTTRHANLVGQWKHQGMGSDHGRVAAYLWKWNATLNKRDTVAFKDSVLTGSQTSWGAFTIPLTYFSGVTPDSSIIIFSSSSSTTGIAEDSYIYIDDLSFTGTVASVASVMGSGSSVVVYPNPASGRLNVFYQSGRSENVTLGVTDLTGHLLQTADFRAIPGENSFTLDLKGLAQGIYFVQISGENGKVQQKFIVE